MTKPLITFFTYGVAKYRQTINPIAEEADKRGWNVQYSTDPFERTDIGIYTTPMKPYHPGPNTDLSVIIFHGIDSTMNDGFVRWDWSRFDVGVLPGRDAAKRWKKVSEDPRARPREGAYRIGWPKSDQIFTDDFRNGVREWSDTLNSKGKQSVLLALSKAEIHELVPKLDNTFNTILVKIPPWSKIDSTLQELSDEYNIVHLVDPDRDIFECLWVSDVVVSSSGSVILESLLTNTYPVAAFDEPWVPEEIDRINIDNPDDLHELTKKHSKEYEKHTRIKNRYYDNVGQASSTLLDLLTAIKRGEHPEMHRVEPKSNLTTQNQIRNLKHWCRNLSLYSASGIIGKMNTNQHDHVRKTYRKLARE